MPPDDLDPVIQAKLDARIANALEEIALEFKDVPQAMVRLSMFCGVREFYVRHDPEAEKMWALINKVQTNFLSPGCSKE